MSAGLAPGLILSGRYQLTDSIGPGEIGAVYGAVDLRNNAPLALKVFEPMSAGRASAWSEFQGQARLASGLGAPGVARTYDYGIDANSGLPFATSERISWPSLDRRVAQQGPLGVADLAVALGVLCGALESAHAAGVVHRDLKPQNVFISSDNHEWVRVTDFGVAALRRNAPQSLGWGGPPGYTPPEGVDAAAHSTPAMDVYALGALAFFALTRGSPFRSLRSGFDPGQHWAELNQPLPPVSERARELGVALDPAFDVWFARALATAPHERFHSAQELAREFQRIAQQVHARGAGGPQAMPGIAAAIAQPLVFQPEPSPASLQFGSTLPVGSPLLSPVGRAAAPATEALPAIAAAPSRAEPSAVAEPLPPLPMRRASSKLPLVIGAAVFAFAATALGAYALLFRSSSVPQDAPASSASARHEPAAAAPPPTTPAESAPAPSARVAAPSENSSAPEAPAATAPSATALPDPAPAPVASAVPATREPSPKPPAPAKPSANAKPSTKPTATATAKPAATATAKPAASATAKPAASAKPSSKPKDTKKKCGTFIACK